jgi:hypothetical protein
MAKLTVQKMGLGGLAPTFAAADAAGDNFDNTGQEYLHVKNGSAAAITATVDSVRACNQGFDHDASVSVPAGGERLIGPFHPYRFGVSTQIAYSAVTSVTVAAVQV